MEGPRTPVGRRFRIHGMDCAEEITALRREVGPVVGGEERLRFDLLGASMSVDASSASDQAIVAAVQRAGMRAEPWSERAAPTAGSWFERHGRGMFTGLSGGAALTGFVLHAVAAGSALEALGAEGVAEAAPVPLPARAVYLTGIVLGVWFVAPKALVAARRLRPDMNLLMTIAVLGAIGIGEWFEAAVVSFLFALSLALESWSIDRARHAVKALMDLAPPVARVLRGEEEVEVPPGDVVVGAHFVVRPGERIPLDGIVRRGQSHVDQSPITGESVPVSKGPGDEVFAGTINGDGAIEVECTRHAGDTTLARIIRMVGEAQSRRAPSERWVESFARVYTPLVLAIALGVLLIPPLAFGAAWEPWLYRALVLLVIGCPCALVISTPVSVVAALAAAARHGVLIKGGTHVETPAGLVALALDKTGTLTLGRPEVVEVVPMNDHTEDELLAIALAIESRSDHPLAQAVVQYARTRGAAAAPATDVVAIPGKGITATLDGRRFWLGSHRYLEERGQETAPVHERLEQLSSAGRSVVLVGDETHVCGLIALADAVRPESVEAIRALRELGLAHVVMLTGDNSGTARTIAQATGVDEVRAELLPADKVAAIEELVARHGRVAMVGDGVNDAPALARATLGIAMGAAGSDAAIETADVALMSDDLSKLPWLVAHSRRALAVVRQNVVFSLGVKGLFFVLTFAGWASLWAAIAADMGASLLVIGNALRLLSGTSVGSIASDVSR